MHEEKKLSSRLMFSGKIIDVYHDKVLLENGNEGLREICVHPGGAAILAVKDSKILLVKQYRYTVQKELIEIPAGKLDKGESHSAAAKRELMEETGAKSEKMIYLGQMHPSPGILTEVIHLYFCNITEVGDSSPDPDEFVTAYYETPENVLGMIEKGEITDAKTICAVTLAKLKGLL